MMLEASELNKELEKDTFQGTVLIPDNAALKRSLGDEGVDQMLTNAERLATFVKTHVLKSEFLGGGVLGTVSISSRVFCVGRIVFWVKHEGRSSRLKPISLSDEEVPLFNIWREPIAHFGKNGRGNFFQKRIVFCWDFLKKNFQNHTAAANSRPSGACSTKHCPVAPWVRSVSARVTWPSVVRRSRHVTSSRRMPLHMWSQSRLIDLWLDLSHECSKFVFFQLFIHRAKALQQSSLFFAINTTTVWFSHQSRSPYRNIYSSLSLSASSPSPPFVVFSSSSTCRFKSAGAWNKKTS